MCVTKTSSTIVVQLTMPMLVVLEVHTLENAYAKKKHAQTFKLSSSFLVSLLQCVETCPIYSPHSV
jgi:hypothetical protein